MSGDISDEQFSDSLFSQIGMRSLKYSSEGALIDAMLISVRIERVFPNTLKHDNEEKITSFGKVQTDNRQQIRIQSIQRKKLTMLMKCALLLIRRITEFMDGKSLGEKLYLCD